MLFGTNSLGSKPYERMANLMQHNFTKNFWNENDANKKSIICEGFKRLFSYKQNKKY